MEDKRKKKIVTHSSKFHSDDIFAVATLLLVLEKEGIETEVIRSRDLEIIKSADYVVDVGFIYDESKNLFDHHQEGGAGERENKIPFSSFGLVWKKYGINLCDNIDIANKVDKVLVQPIDANDNGIQLIETRIKDTYPFTISDIVYTFRPTWKEINNLDNIFIQLVSYAKVLISRQIICIKDEEEAGVKVIEAYEKSVDKRIIILDERYPWEEALSKFPEPLFVIYKKRVDDTWSLKTVQDQIYTDRKSLPESWAGKTDKEFEKITGVEGVVFCHRNRFIAVAKTKEAILKLADIALNN